jgi:hypothetical protein
MLDQLLSSRVTAQPTDTLLHLQALAHSEQRIVHRLIELGPAQRDGLTEPHHLQGQQTDQRGTEGNQQEGRPAFIHEAKLPVPRPIIRALTHLNVRSEAINTP